MTDCNCPTCQALPTKHRIARERDALADALRRVLYGAEDGSTHHQRVTEAVEVLDRHDAA